MKAQIRTLLILSSVLCLLLLYAAAPVGPPSARLLRKISLHALSDTAAPTAREPDLPLAAASAAAPTDSARQTILFIGDSMLEGLSRRLADYAERNGHTLYTVIWYSSTTRLWADTDTLRHFLLRRRPTFVLLCLGSNELFVRDAPTREPAIRRIVQQLDTLPFVWISPPNWKPDTGINELIRRNVGARRYFDSRHLTLARGRDRAHPTPEAAAAWMDTVAAWMSSPATAHPILLRRPGRSGARGHVTVLRPMNE